MPLPKFHQQVIAAAKKAGVQLPGSAARILDYSAIWVGKDGRAFTRAVLRDLDAMERMIDEGLFETGIRRIGAEQELFFVDSAMPAASWQWALIALLALGPGNGHLLMNWAHRVVSASLLTIVLSLVPLLASIWAHLVFGEPYGWLHVAGMLLVVMAIEGGRRAEVAQAA